MIGDFDDSTNALWSLHVKEARSNDGSRIQSLKDDMDGVLIFVGLFSATLTSCIVDKIQGLQSLPPYPDFSPSPSDIWVNVYWFMGLVFSLSAALLATLVQQWVRDYIHPLKLKSGDYASIYMKV
ncbi:hypothetical protein EDB89DRAFT_1902769 [Lactarius sanguifluus]|nr:hypothetical protein EDB89DRAFT_1902769 [Lactarius sanguifluus]